jgi:hypothetical protein
MVTGALAAQPGAPQGAPPFVTRGLPGEGHDAMKALVGKWRVSVTLFMAMGSSEHPVTSTDVATTREWIGGGRFLYDTTTGSIAGAPYWRIGTLGYSNMDRRFEWVTQDGINAGMMVYLGTPNAGPGFPINMTGTFTDQGVLGEAYAGKPIGMRTEIIIKGPDEHVFDLYFTPPGEPERIADRNVYTRMS